MSIEPLAIGVCSWSLQVKSVPELKGLLAHPLLRRNPSAQAIDDYLAYGYVPDDASIIEGVKKLPAGHYLHLRRGRPVPAPICATVSPGPGATAAIQAACSAGSPLLMPLLSSSATSALR